MSNFTSGVKITGLTSGATGFTHSVTADTEYNTRITLTNVVGSFTAGEKLSASDSADTEIENSANTDLTVAASTNPTRDAIVTHEIREVRSLFMDDAMILVKTLQLIVFLH